jgi:GNAT superfamily N-acetyltransferase
MSSSTYDVAVVVADDWQGRGLGRLLMSRLAHIARARGISHFRATIFGDNQRALALVRFLSPRATMQFDAGEVEADIPLRTPNSSSFQASSQWTVTAE